MRIEDYFQQIHNLIAAASLVQLSNVTYDKRGTYEGFIRGELYLVDGSELHLREFVDVEITIERLVYTYQYMSIGKILIFRYDNSGHHRKLNLPTYPHHKHDGSEANVVASSAPTLSDILIEIERLVAIDGGASA